MDFERDKKPDTEGRPKEWFEEMGRRLDQEIEELIRWMNNDVVVAARSHSSRALRVAAEKLARLADKMDDLKRGQ